MKSESRISLRSIRATLAQILMGDRVGPDHIWQLAPSAVRRWHNSPEYRPITLSKVSNALDSLEEKEFQPKYAQLRTTHKVKPGDELRKLAKEHYGDANLSHIIFDANRDILDTEHEIFVGQLLRIPELESA